MLKGMTYSKQLFESFAFRLCFDTFLGGNSGIIRDFANEMIVTSNGTSVTVASGVAIIKGGILRETTQQTLTPILQNNLFYSVVLEIDLSRQNSQEEFNQGEFKLLSGSSNFPSLTQQDIAKNQTGKYQMELARFKTTTTEIIELTDRRKFLNYEYFIQELENAINDVYLNNITSSQINYDNTASGLSATNVKLALDELKTNIDNKTFSLDTAISNSSTTLSVPALNSATKDITITKTGYKATGVGGVITNTSGVNVSGFNIKSIGNGTCTITIKLANDTANQVTASVTAYIMWAKI